jgi:hypothetical protein
VSREQTVTKLSDRLRLPEPTDEQIAVNEVIRKRAEELRIEGLIK